MGKFGRKIICTFIAGVLISMEIGMPVFAINLDKTEVTSTDLGVAEIASGYRISSEPNAEVAIASAEKAYGIYAEQNSFSNENGEPGSDELGSDEYESAEPESDELGSDELGTDELELAEADTESETAELTEEELELAALVETGECGEDLKYSISGSLAEGYTLTITGSGAMNSYDNSSKYSPWRSGKYGNKISKVVMSDDITTIGDSAFHSMESLTGELKLPKNLKSIGKSAFYGCNNLTGNIDIPSGTTTIGSNAFYGCTKFDGKLNLPENMTNIGDSAFEACGKLTGDIIIPSGIASISTRTFAGCSGFNGYLLLPEGLEAIQYEAFLNCSGLTGDVTLPVTFKYLGETAFDGCSGFNGTFYIPAGIETISAAPIVRCTGFKRVINKSYRSITLPELTNDYWYLEGDEAKKSIKYIELGTAIRNSGVDNPVKKEGQCGPSLYYSISGNDTDGYELSFSGSGVMNSYLNTYPWALSSEPYKSKIKSISFCDGMTNIPQSAFREMSGLTGTIDLSDSIETIDASAFAYTEIKEIILGKNLTNLQSEAFYKAASLTKISIRDNTKYLFKNGILYEKNADNDLLLKICLYTRGRLVGEPVINITNDTILSEVVGFARYGIINCPYVTEVDLTGADKINSITASSIVGCENLSSIVLPNNIKRIDEESLVDLNNCEITVYCKDMELNQWGIYGTKCSYVTYSAAPSRNVAKKLGLNVEKTLDPKYKVSYYSSDGSTLLYKEMVTEGENAVGPDKSLIPEIEGFTFIGWNASLENITDDSIRIARYAKSKCKVVFDTKAANYSPIYVNGGETITLPIPTTKGLTFKGWYPTEDGSGDPYTDETIIVDDVTLYAYWYPADVSLKGVKESYEYLGTAIKPVVSVYDGSTLLTEKVDYVVTYKNNVNPYELGKDDAGFSSSLAPTIIVTGRGNYSGTRTMYFKITKHNLFSEDIVINDIAPTLASTTGKEIKPLPVVMQGNRRLVNNKDYTLGYYSDLNCLKSVNPVEPGKYYVRITGMGNYYKYRVVPFEIVDSGKKLLNRFTVKKIPDKQYTGSPITLNAKDIVIMDGKKQLAPGFDYTLEYSGDNVSIGTVTVTITGTGKTYVGSKQATFKIVGTDIKRATISGLITTMVYNGKPRTQTTVKLTHNDNELKGISAEEYEKLTPAQQSVYSYVTEYSKNTDVGTATLLITGVNAYSGTVKKTFKITKFNIANDVADIFKVTLDNTEYEYTKNGVTPDVTVTFAGETLTKGKDYTVTYTNNKLVTATSGKKGTVNVVGKGNYMGKDVTATFSITKRNMDNSGIKITAPDKIATGKKNTWKSPITVIDTNGQKLVCGKDYETNIIYTYENKKPVLASDTVPAGTTIVVEVRGKGDYMGSVKGSYRIYGKDISKYVTTVSDKIYSGRPVTIGVGEVTFKAAGKEVPDVTYVIDASTYKNNTKKGRASVTIRGTGEYGGTKIVTYNITSMTME